MTATSHLRAFQALYLAFRTGSLKDAAEQLSITPAAVGQRIKTLEDYLGVELVARSRTGLKPTAELAGAMDHIRRAFEELERAATALDLQKVDEIHIAAHSDFAELWLWPRIGRYRSMHPNTKFCINGEGDVPMRLGPADCEIRFRTVNEADDPGMLFPDFLVPVTSPVNFERVKAAGKRLELFPLIHLDFYKDDPDAVNWPAWFRRHGHRTTAFERGMRFQRIAPALDAIRSDAGVMIAGLAFVQDQVRASRLRLPFPVATGSWTSFAHTARFRQGSLSRPQIRNFRDWLLKEAAETRTGLEALLGELG